MARLPRLSLPGFLHHVIQRGNNQQVIATCADDFQMLLSLIDDSARKFSVAIHAYVLMGSYFHLLGTPESAQALPQMMQAIGRRYVRYFNDRQGRSGTLWEGRYRSNLLQPQPHLLACMACLDLAPVQAGEVVQARDYPWSSHGHYAGLRVDRMLTPHASLWSLGNTPFAREAAYAELVHAGVPAAHKQALTESALSGWALGDADFVAELQKRTPRRVSKNTAGRPPKNP